MKKREINKYIAKNTKQVQCEASFETNTARKGSSVLEAFLDLKTVIYDLRS